MPTPAWRGTPPVPPTPPPPSGWRYPAAPAAGPRFRFWPVVAVLGGLLATSTLLVWLLMWLAPPGPACLLIVQAGYEDNLAVDHNATGRHAASRLAELARSSEPLSSLFDRSGRLRLAADPVTLERGKDWARSLERAREKTLIVYFAVHGGSDRSGAYLLPNDASADEDDRLRLDRVLDRLAELPASKHKLLLLDVTGQSPRWSLGLLQNDFARALAERESRIADIPNLVVISSSDVGQRSWPSANGRVSLFAHHVERLLSGEANVGRLDASSLFSHLHDRIDQDARRLYGARQTPVMFSSTSESARNLPLTFRLTPPSEDAASDPLPDIRRAWQEYHDNAAKHAAARACDPVAFRLWQAWLVRHEQLRLCGSDRASMALERAGQARDRVRSSLSLGMTSLDSSLALPVLAGERAPGLAENHAPTIRLWQARPDDRAAEWERQVKASADPAALRRAVQAALIEMAARNPATNLSKAAELAKLVDDPTKTERATEANFLVMLARDLAIAPPPDDLGARIRVALRDRVTAEERAVSAARSGEYAYAERIHPHIASPITRADRARQQAEDLLFASSVEHWKECDALRDEVKRNHEWADSLASTWRAAFSARDRALLELPEHAAWIAGCRTGPAEEVVARAAALFAAQHQLDHKMRSPARGEELFDVGEMGELAERVRTGLDRLTMDLDSFARTCESTVPASASDASIVLRVPMLSPTIREALNRQETRRRQGAEARRAEMEALSEDDSVERMAQRGRALALAALPDWPGRAAASQDKGDLIGAKFRDWPLEAERLAEQARASETQRLALLDRADLAARRMDAGQCQVVKLDAALLHRKASVQGLLTWQAQRVARDHWHGDRDRSLPYFAAVSRRLLTDAGNVDPFGKPPAALAAAQLKLGDPDSVAPKSTRRRHLVAGERMTIESELEITGSIAGRPMLWAEAGQGITLEGGQRVPLSNAPRLRPPLTPQPPLPRRGEGEQERAAARLPSPRGGRGVGGEGDVLLPSPHGGVGGEGEGDREPRRTVTITSPDLIRAEEAPPAIAAPIASGVTWFSYYRGRKSNTSSPVDLLPVAELSRLWQPRPATSAIALRGSDSLLDRRGEAKGALCVVLDCSGSMGPGEGREMTERTRYRQATRALRSMLGSVPRGTRVSVWVFGEATGSRKTTVRSEDTIRRLGDAVTWSGERQQLDTIINEAESLEPWNESPVVRAMIRAKDDLTNTDGFRTMVVLTDGVDNRIAKDKSANPEGQTVAEVIRKQFADTGIGIHVVGFQVAAAEEAEYRTQFSVVTKLGTRGTVTTVSELSALTRALRRVMEPDLRWRLLGERQQGPLRDVGRVGQDDRWVDSAPEEYRIQVTAATPFAQRVALRGGDRLLLRLSASGRELACERLLYSLEERFARRPAIESRDWRVAVLQNQLDRAALQMLVSVERRHRPERIIRQVSPGDVWLELDGRKAADGLAAMTCAEVHGYPAPCYGIDVPAWPGTDVAPAEPRLTTWWSPDGAAGRELRRGEHWRRVRDLSAEWKLGGETVSIDGVTIEERIVQIRPGVRERRACLVVRTTHEPNKPIWVRLSGLPTPAGREHRFHAAGRYVGLFWFGSLDTTEALQQAVEEDLTGLEVVSVATMKKESEERKYRAVFDKLEAPAALPVRPTP